MDHYVGSANMIRFKHSPKKENLLKEWLMKKMGMGIKGKNILRETS